MKTLEQRMKALEEMLTEIHAFLFQGKTPDPPGMEEYRLAIEAFASGDRTPLDEYTRKQGKIYPHEEVYPDVPVQRGGSNAPRRRSANLPTGDVRTGHAPG